MARSAWVDVAAGVGVSVGARVRMAVGANAVEVGGFTVWVGDVEIGVEVLLKSSGSINGTVWRAAGTQPSKQNTLNTISNLRII